MFKGIEKGNMKFVIDKLLPVALVIFLFAVLAINFVNNAGTGVIGKDEGVYIINAMGHYEDTAIDVPVGSWIDAIEKGMVRTNDPPGFFFLLHFWEQISFSEIWLRLLPYLFFVIGIITLIRIGFLLKLPPFLSVVMGFLPLVSAQMVYHSIEIRAYGMELCMTYLVMYYALKIIKMINEGTLIGKGTWIGFTLIMALGLSSRWSFVISSTTIYSVLLIVVLLKVKREHLKKYFSSLMISSFASFLVFGVIFMMIFGGKFGVNLPFPSDETRLSQSFGEFAMTGTFLQKRNYFLMEIFRVPLLYAGRCYRDFSYEISMILLYGVCLIILIILYRIIIKIKNNLLIYYGIFLITILVVLLSMLLKYLGLHPFSITSRQSLYLQTFFNIFVISLISLATYKIRRPSKIRDFIDNKLVYTGLVSMLVFFALIYGSLYSSYNVIYRGGGAQHTPDVIRKVVSDNEIKNIDYWYISLGEANSFKYHVLYGRLKNKIPKKAVIIIEKYRLNNWNYRDNHDEIVNKQLNDIYKKAKSGSKVVMITGHTVENEKVYMDNFFKYFTRSKKVGTFVQSSENGEFALGGEQSFFAVR